MKLFPNEKIEEREKIMVMAFIEGLQNCKYSAILRKVNPETLQSAYEILKDERDDHSQIIMKMKMSDDLIVETEIEMLKQKLNTAFDEIKELKAKLSKMTNTKSGERARFNGTCHFCKKTGHMIRDCKLIKRCQICNLTNHTTEQCYRKKENRNKRFRNVEKESVHSVTTSEIENNGENISSSHHDFLNEELNDTYMLSSTTTGTKWTNHIRKNNTKMKQQIYPKEIVNWSNFIEGNGSKPKQPLLKADSNQVEKQLKRPTMTVISNSNPEKAANKPVVSAIVEGNVSKNIFLDSGCECNIVDFTFLRQLALQNNKIKFLRTNSGHLSCANGSKMEIIGYTTLNIIIGNKEMKMKFAVVESIFPNILIGIRSMKTENISIVPAWDCIKIANHSVPFVSKTRATNLN